MKIRIAYLTGERLKADMVAHTLRKMLPDCKVKTGGTSGSQWPTVKPVVTGTTGFLSGRSGGIRIFHCIFAVLFPQDSFFFYGCSFFRDCGICG